MQRVLFITEDYPDGLNGTSVKTRNTLLFLLEQNYQVDLCCAYLGKIQNEIKAEHLSSFLIEKDLPPKFSFKKILRALKLIFSPQPLFVSRLFSLKLKLTTAKLVKQNNYRAIFYDGFSTLVYQAQTDAEQIYIDDEDITILFLNRFRQTKFGVKKIKYGVDYLKSRFYEKKYLPLLDQVWAISPQTKQRLEDLTQASTSVMPTIIPIAQNMYREKSFDLVFTGTLSWEENIVGLRWFLDSHWPYILHQFPELKFNIIGREASPKLIQYLESCEGVKYWGYVEELTDVYRDCALAVSPVLINAGIKVKILTYLSYGLPVVATQVSTLGLVSTDGVRTSEQENFGEEVVKLLKDSKKRHQLAQDGYRNIEKNYSQDHLQAFLQKHVASID